MNNRILYIDIFRGLAIFTVVYSHILLFCTDQYNNSAIIIFLRNFFLYGFFFISGYLGYKKSIWDFKESFNYIYRKTKTLLIPTLICGSVYMISHNIKLDVALFDGAKCGYWFTFTLFLMFLIYAIIMYTIKSSLGRLITFCLIAFISLVLHKTNIIEGKIQDLLTLENLTNYLPIFITGILCKRYELIFNKIIDSIPGKIIIFCIVVLSYIICIPTSLTSLSHTLFIYYILKQLFINCKKPNILSIVGSHSLEIYFLHFFLLFKLPTDISKYLSWLSSTNSCTSFPELIIIGSISLIICFGAIGISIILKQVPFLSQILFGKK